MIETKELTIKGTLKNNVVLTQIETGSEAMSWDEFRMMLLEMIFNLAIFYFTKIGENKDEV